MSCDNKRPCPCTKEPKCENNGKCCACVERHRKMGILPFCLRPAAPADK